MNDYTKAYTEVYYAINNFDEESKSKVPNEFIEFIKSKMNLKYAPIDNSEISEEAKAILSVVYSEYICSDSEKKNWDKLDELFEKSVNSQNSMNRDEFEFGNKKTQEKAEHTEIAVIDNKSRISKILDKIKSFFKSIWRK